MPLPTRFHADERQRKLFGNDHLSKLRTKPQLRFGEPEHRWLVALCQDGVGNFVDHFHTCFVMKALAKIHALTGERPILSALKRGVDYYLENLFAEDGLASPVSKAPRLTVYKRELSTAPSA